MLADELDQYKGKGNSYMDSNIKDMEISRNGITIKMFQGGPLHEPFFIAIDNKDQVITGPNKKIVAMYVVGELEVLM